jgi:hypothetical protein
MKLNRTQKVLAVGAGIISTPALIGAGIGGLYGAIPAERFTEPLPIPELLHDYKAPARLAYTAQDLGATPAGARTVVTLQKTLEDLDSQGPDGSYPAIAKANAAAAYEAAVNGDSAEFDDAIQAVRVNITNANSDEVDVGPIAGAWKGFQYGFQYSLYFGGVVALAGAASVVVDRSENKSASPERKQSTTNV